MTTNAHEYQFPQTEGFHVAHDSGGSPALVRNDKQSWVRHYVDTNVRREYWQAYRLNECLPDGRNPWTVDNKRLGGVEIGFSTIEAAIDAAKNWGQK